MSKRYEERRKYSIGDFEYLLDDEDGTAWIDDGNSGGAKVYTLPEKVEIEDRVFLITSVEAGGFGTDNDRNLEELFIPDGYEYFDEYSFVEAPISKLHIGKGLQYFHPWCLKSAAANISIDIHPQNNSFKMSEDRCFVLSKDGKELVAMMYDVEEATIPDGVERILCCSMTGKERLKTVNFPASLRLIEGDGMIENKAIERLFIPEGVAQIGIQAFCGNDSLKTLDLPSTLKKVQYEFILEDMCLESIILRSPDVVSVDIYGNYWSERIPLETCHLVVPGQLISAYRSHPYWGCFRHIDILND